MTDFHFVFRCSRMFINFGDLHQKTVLQLCGFMRVFDFPKDFFNREDTYYDVVMEFQSRDYVEVTIDGVLCYRGDFDNAWNDYDYYHYFHEIIDDLRRESDAEDILEDLRRDTDYLHFFEDYLNDIEEEDEIVEQEVREATEELEKLNLEEKIAPSSTKAEAKTVPKRGFLDMSDSDSD